MCVCVYICMFIYKFENRYSLGITLITSVYAYYLYFLILNMNIFIFNMRKYK